MKPTRKNRARGRCIRYVRLKGSVAQAGAAGANRVRFTGRLRNRPLAAARYRLLATAIDLAGNRSAAVARGLPDPPPAPSPMTRVRRISLTVALVAATVVALPVATGWAQAPLALTGTVTDGSGHGWPLYARVEVAGQTVYTDPETGRYSVELVAGTTSDIAVTALMAGYTVGRRTVTITPGNTVQDFKLLVDRSCAAPGYAVNTGPPILEESFDGGAQPAGWTAPFAGFGGWTFNDRAGRGNLTGGSGGFAILDSDEFGSGTSEDASLITPAVDLSGAAAPELRFNSDYRAITGSTADVDIQLNAAAPYVTYLHQGDDSRRGPRTETIPITEGIGEPAVNVRFRYQGTWDWWWEVDNVTIVDRCMRRAGRPRRRHACRIARPAGRSTARSSPGRRASP